MRSIGFTAIPLAVLSLLLGVLAGQGQEETRQILPSTGWGSLSGKVTLSGELPVVEDLVPKMMIHTDKDCCLAGKPSEKVDQTWIVDPSSKGVANVVVWIMPPKGSYFPLSEKAKKHKDQVVIDQPHCAFLPRISAINPVYYDGAKHVPSGQTLLVKNSADVQHNVRALGHPDFNPGFNKNMPAKTELEVTFKPQLLPVSLNCDIHPWMAAKLFVFDHPYYAVTKEDGSYEIPVVPAGAQVSIMGWHEGVGWLLTKKGAPIMLKAGANTYDLQVKR